MTRKIDVDGYPIACKNAPDYIKKGYKSWSDQRQRCTNPKDKRYKWYGAKGIRVEYTSKELILWYKEEFKKNNNWKRPQISRLNHNDNYRFGNIELVECSENSKERMERLGPGTKPHKIIAINVKTKEEIIFDSIRLASRILKVSKSGIQHHLLNGLQNKPRNNWLFKYY